MKRGEGVGGDKFNFEMLEKGGEYLWHNLHAILHCCWEEEHILQEWTEGIIVPLHKGGVLKTLETTVESRWVVM